MGVFEQHRRLDAPDRARDRRGLVATGGHHHQATVVWATFLEDLEHLEQANDKLMASDSFTDLADRGAGLFVGPMSDGLAQVVVGEVDPSAPQPAYVTAARAIAANGHLREALDGGAEIAAAATRITGPTMFLVDSTGAYGGCSYSDIGQLEQAEAALMADSGWIDLISRVGAAYAPGASQAIYRLAS